MHFIQVGSTTCQMLSEAILPPKHEGKTISPPQIDMLNVFPFDKKKGKKQQEMVNI